MEKSALYGMFRARVVSNKDLEQFGRVLVWIPDFMPEVDPDEGIWARPANNPIGGRNMESETDNYYAGSSYIPKIGSWVFVFFEGGNINRPYYFGALDLQNTKVLPENQVGTNYENKWTILKSHEGRAIVVSDDPDDERVEITGKKREMTNPPTGDTESVYKIDDNMTTILLDERDEQQKILIRTYEGDFIHIDIEDRQLQIYFDGDFEIKSGGTVYFTSTDDIHLKSEVGDIHLQADSGKVHIKSGQDMNLSSGGNMNEKAQKDHLIDATDNLHRKAGSTINHDAGGTKYEQSGTSQNAGDAEGALSADPEGERDT
jgi:hypothetical protein